MMESIDALRNSAVIGAAGKMGSGIAWLLLELAVQEMLADIPSSWRLVFVDESESGLLVLKSYLQSNVLKIAEKRINILRKRYLKRADLVSNQEMIDAFLQEAMGIVHFGMELEEARRSKLIFEAIVEDEEAKCVLFKNLAAASLAQPYFFTNTSSIPISLLNEKAGLEGRLIGFHFYNPPAVQKLLEVIPLFSGDALLFQWALEIGRKLNKAVIVSKDTAGFIGNGFFIREIAFACSQVRKLLDRCSLAEAIYFVDQVTEKKLLRPMGIFQLIDYVGVDVCARIGEIMGRHLPGSGYRDPLIRSYLMAGRKGGHDPAGFQREGFFYYKEGKIDAVFAPEGKVTVSVIEEALRSQFGEVFSEKVSWKQLSKDPHPSEKLSVYFSELLQEKTMAAEMAKAFLLQDRKIAKKLVQQGIAASLEDIGQVLKLGFYHLVTSEEVLNGTLEKEGLCGSRL